MSVTTEEFGSDASGPTSPQSMPRATLPAREVGPDVFHVPVDHVRRAGLDQGRIEIESLDESRVVDERFHRRGVEEVGGIPRRLGEGRRDAQERPVRLGVGLEGGAGTVDGLPVDCHPVEELGHVVILRPRPWRRRQVVAVLRLEIALVFRIREQVAAIVHHVRIAVVGQAVDLAAPGEDPLPVRWDQGLVANLVLDLLRNFDGVARSHDVTRPVRGVHQDVERIGAGHESRADLLEQVTEGECLDLHGAAGLLFPQRLVLLQRSGDLRFRSA